MKTRNRKSGATSVKEVVGSETAAIKRLDDNVAVPPHCFILPKNISSESRIVSLQQEILSKPKRYLVCPQHGFYEFTRITAPKQSHRSWLFAPAQLIDNDRQITDRNASDITSHEREVKDTEASPTSFDDAGYIVQRQDLFVATPIDPVFVILPSLLDSNGEISQEYLAPSDYLVSLTEAAPHLAQLIQPRTPGKLEQMLENRLRAVCDCIEMGEDKLYALSLPKLVRELVSKATRATSKGFPLSLETRFVRQPLETPESGIKREGSSIGLISGDATVGTEDQTTSESDLQNTRPTTHPSIVATTAVASETNRSARDAPSAPAQIVDSLRLRTALDFIIRSYVPISLHTKISELLYDPNLSSTDLFALDKHLAQVESLKRQALALRSMSDNISRKRSTIEDEETTEKADAKRRKKEEEESKKRNTSQGVRQLMKADTSGMKKMSAFFSKTPAKK